MMQQSLGVYEAENFKQVMSSFTKPKDEEGKTYTTPIRSLSSGLFNVQVNDITLTKFGLERNTDFVTNLAKTMFGKILPSDYVLLIDNIPDSQFILGNREHDLNIKISPFNIKHPDNYNIDYDQLEIASILEHDILPELKARNLID